MYLAAAIYIVCVWKIFIFNATSRTAAAERKHCWRSEFLEGSNSNDDDESSPTGDSNIDDVSQDNDNVPTVPKIRG